MVKIRHESDYPAQQLAEDYRTARDLGRVRLGALGVYFPKISGPVFRPWAEFSRAWMRQEEVNANLCCGRGGFDQFYLILAERGGTEHKLHMISKAQAQAGLDEIARRCPQVQIGYQKNA